jgi:hypothetical protein
VILFDANVYGGLDADVGDAVGSVFLGEEAVNREALNGVTIIENVLVLVVGDFHNALRFSHESSFILGLDSRHVEASTGKVRIGNALTVAVGRATGGCHPQSDLSVDRRRGIHRRAPSAGN